MQKIYINYLGPVKKLDMEIKDFNLLIGEQATGKSTVAKCIYFFRNIKTTITDYLCQLYDTSLYNGEDAGRGFSSVLKKEFKSVFISLFGYSWDLDERLYLKYEFTSNIWIDVKLFNKRKKYISVRYSNLLSHKVRELEQEALALYSQTPDTSVSLAFASNEQKRIRKKIKDSINSLFHDYKETYYIPAGRSMITLLVNNRSMIKNENNLDLITRQFMQTIDSIHAVFSEGIRNVHKKFPDGERKFDVVQVAELLIGNLKGDYRYTPGKEYIIVEGQDEKTQIPINFASSGQQEVLWLLNLLYYLMLIKETAFVIIEEPEAHLYPSLQKKIVDFIAFFMNINESSVFITSHSPYILTACNTLYCAGKLLWAVPEASKRVRDIIGNGRELRPDIFSAFKIQKDGILINLIDDEMQEITTDLIDEISDVINASYVDLFYLSEELNGGGMGNAREI